MMAEASAPTSEAVCLIVLGMAGSGKTTFVHRLASHLRSTGDTPYTINLDPAVHQVPYPANIDIRDTIKYKEVMKQYGLGPNGAIMTSLNLFATKFDQVVDLLTKRCVGSDAPRHIIVDTPGQIEVFTWSASGAIITEALASTLPTVVVYVMDVPRSHSPVTFMSNMLYACSILYKSRLPFLLVLNKVDIMDAGFALEWIRDFEAFQVALRHESSYSSNLAHSMSLVLDEFYAGLRVAAVSSMTGDGLEGLLKLTQEARAEFQTEFQARYQRMKGRRRPTAEVEQRMQEMFLGDQQQEEEEEEGRAEEAAETEEQLGEESFQRFVENHLAKAKQKRGDAGST